MNDGLGLCFLCRTFGIFEISLYGCQCPFQGSVNVWFPRPFAKSRHSQTGMTLSGYVLISLFLTVRNCYFHCISAYFICRLPLTRNRVRIRLYPTKSFAIRYARFSEKSAFIRCFCAKGQKKPDRKGLFLTGFGRGDRI